MVDIRVICTGDGAHGEVLLASLELVEGVVTPRLTRNSRAVWGKDAVLTWTDGAEYELPRTYVDVAPDPREEFEGNLKWRYTCGKCGRSPVFSDTNMRTMAERAAEKNYRKLDVSLTLNE